MSHSKSSKGLQWDRTFSSMTLNGGADCVGRDWSQKTDLKVKGGVMIRKGLCTASGLDVVGNIDALKDTRIAGTLNGNGGNLIVVGNVVANGNVSGGEWVDTNIDGNLLINLNTIYYNDDVQQVLLGNCLPNDNNSEICVDGNNSVLMTTSGTQRGILFPAGSFQLHNTTSTGQYSFSEGLSTVSLGFASHSEGYGTKAHGYASHAQGYYTYVSGRASHVESYTYPYFIGGNTTHAECPVSISIGNVSHTEMCWADIVGDISHDEATCPELYAPMCHSDAAQYIWSSTKQGLDHMQGDSMWSAPNGVTNSNNNGLNHSSATIGYNFGYCSHVSRACHVSSNSGDFAHCSGRGTFTNQHAVWGFGTSDGSQDYLTVLPQCESDMTGQYQVTMYHIRTKTDGLVSGNLSLKYPEMPETYPEVTYAPEPPDTASNAVGGPLAASNQALKVINGHPAVIFRSSTSDLDYQRADNVIGDSWPGSFTIYSGTNITYESLANINGNPALCVRDVAGGGANVLKFIRANDIDGDVWGNVINVSTSGNDDYFYNYLADVNGYPAVAYVDAHSNELKYVRAADANGTTWMSPVILDTGAFENTYQKLTLKVVDGAPAISYTKFTGSDKLMYVRAMDMDGTAWNPPIQVVGGDTGLHASMDVINGHPAIAYLSKNLLQVAYIRATNPQGSAWGMPIVLANSTNSSFTYKDPSLSFVCGVPNVIFLWDIFKTVYLSIGDDADGTTFYRKTLSSGIDLQDFNLIENNNSIAYLTNNVGVSPNQIEYKQSTGCASTSACIFELQNVRHQIWKVDLTITGKDTITEDCFGQKIHFTAYHNEEGSAIIIDDVQKGTEFSTGTLAGSIINILSNENKIMVNTSPSSNNICKWAGTLYVTNAGIQDYADRYFDAFFLENY